MSTGQFLWLDTKVVTFYTVQITTGNVTLLLIPTLASFAINWLGSLGLSRGSNPIICLGICKIWPHRSTRLRKSSGGPNFTNNFQTEGLPSSVHWLTWQLYSFAATTIRRPTSTSSPTWSPSKQHCLRRHRSLGRRLLCCGGCSSGCSDVGCVRSAAADGTYTSRVSKDDEKYLGLK